MLSTALLTTYVVIWELHSCLFQLLLGMHVLWPAAVVYYVHMATDDVVPHSACLAAVP